MVEAMKIELIDFGIDFIKYKFEDLTHNIRIFNKDYLEFEIIELKDIEIFQYNSKAYNHLKSYKNEELDIFMELADNYFFNINPNKGIRDFLLNDLINLNNIEFKVQDINYIKKYNIYGEIDYISIKYFLYNKEQNRTITLYDHQIKFIQEHFNKT